MTTFRRRFGVPVVIVLVVWTLTTHGKFSDSGDEPHYLVIAESLLADHDLDLENNYDHGSGAWFGADGLTAGLHARRNAGGALWSGHDIGLPVLLLPVYAVATRLSVRVPEAWLARVHQTRGLFAYSLISFSLILLNAWAAALLLAGLRRMTSERQAAAIVLALFLSPPVMGHAFLVFPEAPAFAVVCAVVWLICLRPGELTTARVLGVVVAVGAMPWLHRKFSFLSLGLLGIIAAQHWSWLRRQRGGVLASAAALGLVPQAALHLWTLREWGHLGGGFMTAGLPFSASVFQTGALGLFLDRERGLVSYAPIFLIVPACLAFSSRTAWRALVPIPLLLLPLAAFVVWGGGFSPPARYVVPIVPLLAYAAVRGLERPIIRGAAVVLLVFQAAISAYVWQYPRAMWPKELGTNQALEHIPWIGPAYERWLPSLLTGDSVTGGWLCVAAIAAATVALMLAAMRVPGLKTRPPSE